jgi:hypothetical protein
MRTIEQAFDEWMRRYVEEPERFSREWQSVETFKSEGGMSGSQTSYGRSCAEYLQRLIEES